MPVRKRADKRRNAEPDHDTRWNLDLGWLADTSDEAMRVAWEQYRDFFMAQPLDRAGRRPYGWWIFESGLGHQPADEESTLYEMGLLDDAEITTVRHIYEGLPQSMWPRFMRD
ncbi:MAG: hypothetical protein E5W91_32700 [Mesorhizobium sp.]|uniref:hypothetical protein n=1 Tax=Mesorhizobium sp. TaxID=1871066 RepID=UPI00121AFEF4|nr:hypothetical protein [Mesorhizobium sp.]TIS53036.1 MAG: hypothetical protein E5W91_32700 [Mesorhizobium sp.]